MDAKSRKFPIRASARLAVSFISIFFGWCCAYFAWILIQVHGPGCGYITDYEFMLLWPAIYVFAGWITFVLPVVGFVDHRYRFFQQGYSVMFGATCGIAVFVLLTGITGLWGLLWELWKSIYFLGFAAVVGAITLSMYSMLVSSDQIQELSRRSYFSPTTFSIPIVAILCFNLLVWPGVELLFPVIAYRYGSTTVRNRIEERVIRTVKAGDRFEDLKAKLPGNFGSGGTVLLSSRGDGFSYKILFEDGVVSSIETTNKR